MIIYIIKGITFRNDLRYQIIRFSLRTPKKTREVIKNCKTKEEAFAYLQAHQIKSYLLI